MCWMGRRLLFQVDSKAEADDPGRNELAVVITPDGLYLVVTGLKSRVTVSKLTVKTHGDHIDNATVTFMGSVAEDSVPFVHSGHVVMGGVYKDKLALIGGTHGCGFRWEPEKPTVFHLGDKSATKLQTTVSSHSTHAHSPCDF
jgi:hypothetical protein